MTISASHAILLAGISLLSGSYVLADEPDSSSTMSAMVLPAQRTPVYVWPIMRGCTPDKPATAAVVRKLNADPRLEIHRLSVPADPRMLTCSGASCAEFLSGSGCQPRSGILVGGEIDEAPCDANDRSLLGCTGQLLARVRVFRVNLEQNQPTRGDYRYALCQDGRCGTEAISVPDSVSQLIDQLVGTLSLPSPPAAARVSPEPENQCTGSLAVATTPTQEISPVAAPDLTGKAVIYAYYTQYKHLGAAGTPATKEQAEQEAKTHAGHFTDGVTLPAGPHYVTTPVNTKYALLPGEGLVGNVRRITTLQGFLAAPPQGPAYEAFRKTPLQQRHLIVLVLDEETKSLGVFLIEPNKPMRTIAPPTACQSGSGETVACVSAAALDALSPAAATATAPAVTVATVAATPKRSLGCIPYRERSCPACINQPAPTVATVLPQPFSPLPPPETIQPRKWTDRFLYAALGVSLLTAGALTIADSVTSPIVLTDPMGNTASITGLLRPAQWTAWGLSLVLAVPTAISVIENGRPKPHEPPMVMPVAKPSGPRCPISDER